jgi:DNA-binding response OmpR family regulator
MCGDRHRHHRRGSRGRFRAPSREQLLDQLEEHQRDLEQEVADVADLIRRLREERSAEQEQPASI